MTIRKIADEYKKQEEETNLLKKVAEDDQDYWTDTRITNREVEQATQWTKGMRDEYDTEVANVSNPSQKVDKWAEIEERFFMKFHQVQNGMLELEDILEELSELEVESGKYNDFLNDINIRKNNWERLAKSLNPYEADASYLTHYKKDQ
jgi:hypothetical protein